MNEPIRPIGAVRPRARPPRRRVAALIASFAALLITAVVCTGCAGDADRGDGAETGNATNEIAAESPAADGRGAADIDIPLPPVAADERDDEERADADWEEVSSVGTIRGTRVLTGLLRHLDVHYEGGLPTVLVTWEEPGNAVDDFGRTLPIFAEEWKGMLEAIVSRARRDEAGISRWRAMPSQMYTDGYGEVTRHDYRVFIESNNRIRLENDGPAQ